MKLMFALLIGLWSTLTMAQDFSPRAYWPAPTGTQLLSVGLGYTTGDIVPDPSLPVVGLDSDIVTLNLAYGRTLNLWGRSSNLIVELPFSDGETKGSLEATPAKRNYDGVGDLGVTLSMNFMGAPALSRDDFEDLRRDPRPLLGASIKVVAPTGDYDNDRVVNVGSNRWATRLEVAYMAVLNPEWLLEFELGAWFMDDNDDFLGMTREQDEIYAAEVHLVRRFEPGFWASLDLNGYRGGRSTVGDQRLNDLQRDSKIGFTLMYPVARGHALKGSYSHGSLNDSDETFDTFIVSYNRYF